jgi:hypothetical protein
VVHTTTLHVPLNQNVHAKTMRAVHRRNAREQQQPPHEQSWPQDAALRLLMLNSPQQQCLHAGKQKV